MTLACERPTPKSPEGRTGTPNGFAAHERADESPCFACARAKAEYLKRYGVQNKDRIAKYNRDRRDDRQVIIDKFKAVPCADCGNTFPPICMDFDHLPGEEKLFNVSRVGTRGIEAALAEIAKCEVVCANCHRIRTAERVVRKHPKKVANG